MTEESSVKEDLPEVPAELTPPPFRILGDRAKLFSALAKARAAFATLETSKTAEVQGTTSSGKQFNYTFDYADLATLQAATIPGLTANGLNIIQTYWDSGKGHILLTLLTHDCGASIEVEVFVPDQGNVQKMASALTYHKRYQWGGLCGIAAKRDDDDGNVAAGNTARFTEKPQVSKPAQKPQERPKPPPAAKPAPTTQSAPQSQPASEPAPSQGEARRVEEQEQAATHAPPATDHDPATGEVPAVGPVTEGTANLLKATMRGAGIVKRPQAVALLVEFCGKGAIDDLTEAEALKLLEPGNIPELMKKLGFGAP